ncbi:TPA: hypothetical protein DIV55_04070 [Patescibacteria group bacterium]|uniref:Lysyl-tRNA synthetase-like protein GenX n=1 Tax=Candidatus Gottesmanbacteria bacterium GW2011_GWA1_43_11 TaxID=1618436 RepID=A0A0G1CGG3_9BACT|nr:MAG: Lysyl-tRNA synthetase-like protein GenX [Candidatus Gottesmanbacteria bacterium GW2011_GWA1_43_11]HCS78894.1 hypothetical protein [Patescibacteria group bacterium]
MKITTYPTHLKNHQRFLKIKQLIDEFLPKQGYTKVEAPLLSPVLLPESYLDIFATAYRYFQKPQELYLTPSSELFLKRLLASGIGSCYTLDQVFRNSEPTVSKHNFEFTMLELYKVSANYFQIAADTLALLRFIAQKLFGKPELIYQGKVMKLDSFETVTVAEVFENYAQIPDIFNHQQFFSAAKARGYRIEENFSYVDLWSEIYSLAVEPHLGMNGRATLIYDYPKELAAMVNYNSQKQVAERLELYIAGVELGNCGNETSSKGVRKQFEQRFKEEIHERKRLGKSNYEVDWEFLDVLEQLPKTAGIAIGVDRLAMLFCDVRSIEELKVVGIK